MSYLVETIEKEGIKVNIYQDDDAESPDHWGNDDAFLVYDHRGFSVERRGFDPTEIFEYLQESKRKTFKTWKSIDGKPTDVYYWVFPVYAYIHSGVALSLGRSSYPFNDRWDVSFKGFALVKRQKGWTYTEEKAYKVAQSIIEEWNQYLSGDVYGFSSDDIDDSCWGFYGLEYIREEVNNVIDGEIKRRKTERINKVKTFIRNHVSLTKRLELLA